MLLALLLLTIAGVVLSLRPPVKAEAQILEMPEKVPTYPSHPIDRLIPMQWGWLWRIRYAILGHNPSIHIEPNFIELSDTPEHLLSLLLPKRPPFAQTNGMQAWILPAEEYRALQTRLQSAPDASQIARCGITTGPWVQADLSSGYQLVIKGMQRPSGLKASIYTRLNGKAVVLTTLFTISRAITNPPPADFKTGDAGVITIQTNLSFAGRFVVPESNGVFVLDSSRFEIEHQRTAILLAPRVEPYQPK